MSGASIDPRELVRFLRRLASVGAGDILDRWLAAERVMDFNMVPASCGQVSAAALLCARSSSGAGGSVLRQAPSHRECSGSPLVTSLRYKKGRGGGEGKAARFIPQNPKTKAPQKAGRETRRDGGKVSNARRLRNRGAGRERGRERGMRAGARESGKECI